MVQQIGFLTAGDRSEPVRIPSPMSWVIPAGASIPSGASSPDMPPKDSNASGGKLTQPIFQAASKSRLMHRGRGPRLLRLLKGLSDLASPVLKQFLKDAARAPGAPGTEASMRCQVRSFVF